MEISRGLKFWLKNKYWIYLLYIPIYLVGFFVVEAIVDGSCDYWVSYAPLDDLIPFVDWFVIPYELWYPFMAVVGFYLFFKDRDAYERMIKMAMFGFSFSLIFFLIFPNGQNLRLESFEEENIFTHLISNLWKADTHTNVLPSMHVYGSLFTMYAVYDSKAIKSKFVVCGSTILGLLICAATVFIKQHSILDVYAGFVLFAIFYWIIYYHKIFKNFDGSIEYKTTLQNEFIFYKRFV